ncbi:hypothetical protein [Enterococcus caccae]|uniref:Uncharacterized protein n=1 Tax=Enterococcus caccae ATCC BAA-1240 TaxID=1158612 RepID=R3WCZ2_9ENTE|nr:hypothetical protein [Enterococcus caccae]EOL45771.1 hypothetical protein UC7_01568 [Enterococcus caccae ATCC BAA-1240]EOT60967.1 hypothetical protein I580_01869 [Enterococcus caccae ATCC BAA-1240]
MFDQLELHLIRDLAMDRKMNLEKVINEKTSHPLKHQNLNEINRLMIESKKFSELHQKALILAGE